MGATTRAEADAIARDYGAVLAGLTSLPIAVPGTPYARARAARDRLLAGIRDAIGERRARPTDDGLSRMLAAEVTGEPPMTDREALLEVHHFVIAGFIVYLLMAEVMRRLAEDPSLRRRCADEYRGMRRAERSRWLRSWPRRFDQRGPRGETVRADRAARVRARPADVRLRRRRCARGMARVSGTAPQQPRRPDLRRAGPVRSGSVRAGARGAPPASDGVHPAGSGASDGAPMPRPRLLHLPGPHLLGAARPRSRVGPSAAGPVVRLEKDSPEPRDGLRVRVRGAPPRTRA